MLYLCVVTQISNVLYEIFRIAQAIRTGGNEFNKVMKAAGLK